MASQLGWVTVFVSASVAACASVPHPKAADHGIQQLKNYALSTCIADGLGGEAAKDAAAAARGYLEFGDLPLEAHTEATLLGRKFLAREYKSSTGEKMVIMKCIDFYNSPELEQLAQRYSHEP